MLLFPEDNDDKYPLPMMLPVTKQTLRPVRIEPDDRLLVEMSKDGSQFRLTVSNVRHERSVPSPGARAGWFQRIPARKQVVNAINVEYLAEATDCTVTAIACNWRKRQINFASDFARLTFAHVMATMFAQESNVKQIAEYRQYCGIRDKLLSVCAPTQYLLGDQELIKSTVELPFALHQDVAALAASRAQGFAYFMEQGTGKTPPTIGVLCHEARKWRELQIAKGVNPRMYRTIIVVPKNVRFNWEREIERFKSCEGSTTIVKGHKMARAGQILTALAPADDDQLFTAVVIGYETMVNTFDIIGRIPWDLAVLDESHYIKTPTTQRTKIAHKLRDVSQKRMCLTGTPITNYALDLWSQLEFLGKGMSGFNTFKSFKKFYGVFETDGDGFERLLSVQNLPFIRERLGRCAFVVKKEEALPNLPEKVFDVVEVEMGAEQLKCYNDLRTKLALEIESDMDRKDNRQLLVSNVLVKLLRLAQITSGFIKWDEIVDPEGEIIKPKETGYFDPNPKLDACFQLCLDDDKTVDDKTIIWANWTDDIEAIMARFEELGVPAVSYYGKTTDKAREIAEHRFNNDPTLRFFVGNAAAGGTGLNLLGHPPANPEQQTSDCTHVIYYSQGWSATQRSQSSDRPHRRGTRKPVRITDLMVPGSIDEEIRVRVTEKLSHALEVTDLTELLTRCLLAVA